MLSLLALASYRRSLRNQKTTQRSAPSPTACFVTALVHGRVPTTSDAFPTKPRVILQSETAFELSGSASLCSSRLGPSLQTRASQLHPQRSTTVPLRSHRALSTNAWALQASPARHMQQLKFATRPPQQTLVPLRQTSKQVSVCAATLHPWCSSSSTTSSNRNHLSKTQVESLWPSTLITKLS